MSSQYFLSTFYRKRKLKSTRAGLFDCFSCFFSGSVAVGFCVILKNLLFLFVQRIAQLEDSVRRNQYALEKAAEEQQVQARLYSFHESIDN